MISVRTAIGSILVFFLIFIATLPFAGPADSATITVKQLGGGDYTSITEAINNAFADDKIEVYAGRYEEAVVIDKDLNLVGAGPQVTTIASLSHGIVVKSLVVVTIEGFEITSTGNGIYLEPDGNATIRNNCIVNNIGMGIRFYGGSTTSIINNTIHNNGAGGINNNENSGVNVNIFNNIVTNNEGYGLFMRHATVSISHNDVFGNTTNYHYCAAGAGDITENPRFIDANSNYVLRSDSPCINAGRSGSVDADPDGSRNDMGAYGGPYAASFWPYPPGAPIVTNLTATPTSVPKGEPITINAVGEIK